MYWNRLPSPRRVWESSIEMYQSNQISNKQVSLRVYRVYGVVWYRISRFSYHVHFLIYRTEFCCIRVISVSRLYRTGNILWNDDKAFVQPEKHSVLIPLRIIITDSNNNNCENTVYCDTMKPWYTLRWLSYCENVISALPQIVVPVSAIYLLSFFRL